VTLVAVSKRQPAAAVVRAADSGLIHFGENYLQEGIEKMRTVARSDLKWHFIGKIQSNKTRQIAENFSWVDTIDRARIADRLDAQRPDHLGPIDVLIQLNVDNEAQKGGVSPKAALPLARHISQLPALRLRGVLGMPPAGNDATRNRASFLAIAEVAGDLRKAGFEIDTISMGMSSDYELAIECGSNCVRIGTALFGPRDIFSTT
jgi:pyridoxal phosphate enzyme (YggS family)